MGPFEVYVFSCRPTGTKLGVGTCIQILLNRQGMFVNCFVIEANLQL